MHKSIATVVRRAAETAPIEKLAGLEPGHFNATIRFKMKSNYGNEPLMYVESDHKEALQQLTGSKTLADRHVQALKNLGFHFLNMDKNAYV